MNALESPRVFLVAALLLGCAGASANDSTCQGADAPGEGYHPGDGWSLAWSDEFTGQALDEASWNRQVVPPGRFNDEWQRYTASPENAFVQDGCLVIRALHTGEGHGMGQYTSARLNTAQKRTFLYGRIAARIRVPVGNGTWPAFWTLGANIDENGGDTPWPQSGEIDILEYYGSRSETTMEANIHYANASGRHGNMGAQKYTLPEGRFADGFHVFEVEWSEQSVEWFVDGQPYAEFDITPAWLSEFHQPHFILLNLAIGGRNSGRPDETTPFPVELQVDWVRVFQPD